MSSTTTDRPRLRSSTFGSLQTLTRALRESLRLRKLRKQKRLRNEANNEQMRRRSKSVGNAYVDDEISEIGISVAVASDIGPVLNSQKMVQKKSNLPKRRQSKSVDDVELAQIRRSIESEAEKMAKLQPNSNNGQIRRRSKDDHDLPKVSKTKDSAYYVSEQKGFRKRFGKLFGSLRMKHQTHTQLQPETPTPSSASSEGEDRHVEKVNENNIKTNNNGIKDTTNEVKPNETIEAIESQKEV